MARFRVEHRIGVPTPPESIWQFISDIPGWADWNPLYPKAEGTIRIGNVLALELALPGEEAREIRPVVLDWAPYDHLHWKDKMLRGWVRTTRYLEIEKLDETACIFTNGEIYDGALAGLVARKRRVIRRGFEALGEAIRAKALAAWQAEQAATTSSA